MHIYDNMLCDGIAIVVAVAVVVASAAVWLLYTHTQTHSAICAIVCVIAKLSDEYAIQNACQIV